MKGIIYNDYGTNDLRKDYFLSILSFKNGLYINRENYEGVYFPTSALETLLGESKYKNRLQDLKGNGFISSYISPKRKSKYNRQLYFIIPNDIESVQTKTVSEVSFIRNYLNQRYKSIISQDLEYQYQTLTNTYFDFSAVEYRSDIFKSQDYYNSTIYRLDNFNNSNKIERVNYISKDDFSGRVHSILTNIPSIFREQVLISNKPTIEIDLKQAQIVFLNEILLDNIGHNSFSELIKEGNDIYLFIKDKFKLKSRDDAKEYTFKMLFGKPYNKKALELYSLFPDIQDFIIKLKSNKVEGNNREYHKNLAYLLQKYEVEIFTKVWKRLKANRIRYLSVHDSIITNSEKAYDIMFKELSKQLSVKPILKIK